MSIDDSTNMTINVTQVGEKILEKLQDKFDNTSKKIKKVTSKEEKKTVEDQSNSISESLKDARKQLETIDEYLRNVEKISQPDKDQKVQEAKDLGDLVIHLNEKIKQFEDTVKKTIVRQHTLEERTKKHEENKIIIKDFSVELKKRINTLQEEQNGFVDLKTDAPSNLIKGMKKKCDKNIEKLSKSIQALDTLKNTVEDEVTRLDKIAVKESFHRYRNRCNRSN